MGRGGAIYLSYTALVLLSRLSGCDASSGLWDVDIDHSPAPPAESGPPSSANATRDRAELPHEIIAIVGSYIGSILILGTLILTVGRRSRKRALMMADKPTEMVKPSHRTFDPSPISPRSFRNWGNLRKKRSEAGSIKSSHDRMVSPGTYSVASFDSHVIEQDRRRQQDALAAMYDAVYEQDGQNSAPPYAALQDAAPASPVASRHNLRRLDLERVNTAGSGPLSPQPKSPYYAVAPPRDILEQLSPHYERHPQSPRTPQHTRNVSNGSTRTYESSPSKLKKGMRQSMRHKLHISSPIQGSRGDEDGMREPLSPKFYENPGPPPEVPLTACTMPPYSPKTPGTARSFDYGSENEHFDEVRALPPAHPQRRTSFERSQSGAHVVPKPPALVIPPPMRQRDSPISSTSNQLPLRQYAERQKASQLSLRQQPPGDDFPLSPTGVWNTRRPLSPGLKSPALQETVLTARNMRMGPQTANDLPYSPYFPGVYSTPITPHFTTKAERKQKQKEEKAVHGAITEEDQVTDEKEMWGDAY